MKNATLAVNPDGVNAEMTFFGLIIIIVVPIVFLVWLSQKESIGTIQCQRCGHVGKAKGLFVPFRGVKPVCAKCHGEDWRTYTPVEPTLTPEQEAAIREAKRLRRESERVEPETEE